VSVINRMLQELDRRQADAAASGGAVPLEVRAVAPRRSEREWFWRIVAVLMFAAVCWVAWVAYQLQPVTLVVLGKAGGDLVHIAQGNEGGVGVGAVHQDLHRGGPLRRGAVTQLSAGILAPGPSRTVAFHSFRVGNASRKFAQVDSYVRERLALFLSKKRRQSGRQWERWTLAFFQALGVYQLAGTVRWYQAPSRAVR